MKRKVIAILLSASLMAMPAIAKQTDQLDLMAEEMCQRFESSADQYIKNEHGLSPQVFAEFLRNGQLLLTNKVFVRYLLDQFDQVGLLDQNKSANELRLAITNFSGLISQKLFQLGLRRLDTNDQRAFFQYRKIWFDSLDNQDCECILDGSTPKAAQRRIAINQFENLTPDEIRNYFRIFRKAIFAEINDYPLAPTLTQEQEKYVEMALSNAMQKELQTMMPDERQATVNSMMNKLQANQPSCELMKLTYGAALSLSGPTAAWVFTALSSDM